LVRRKFKGNGKKQRHPRNPGGKGEQLGGGWVEIKMGLPPYEKTMAMGRKNQFNCSERVTNGVGGPWSTRNQFQGRGEGARGKRGQQGKLRVFNSREREVPAKGNPFLICSTGDRVKIDGRGHKKFPPMKKIPGERRQSSDRGQTQSGGGEGEYGTIR